jgi:hypothetical protein
MIQSADAELFAEGEDENTQDAEALDLRDEVAFQKARCRDLSPLCRPVQAAVQVASARPVRSAVEEGCRPTALGF